MSPHKRLFKEYTSLKYVSSSKYCPSWHPPGSQGWLEKNETKTRKVTSNDWNRSNVYLSKIKEEFPKVHTNTGKNSGSIKDWQTEIFLGQGDSKVFGPSQSPSYRGKYWMSSMKNNKYINSRGWTVQIKLDKMEPYPWEKYTLWLWVGSDHLINCRSCSTSCTIDIMSATKEGIEVAKFWQERILFITQYHLTC